MLKNHKYIAIVEGELFRLETGEIKAIAGGLYLEAVVYQATPGHMWRYYADNYARIDATPEKAIADIIFQQRITDDLAKEGTLWV